MTARGMRNARARVGEFSPRRSQTPQNFIPQATVVAQLPVCRVCSIFHGNPHRRLTKVLGCLYRRTIDVHSPHPFHLFPRLRERNPSSCYSVTATSVTMIQFERPQCFGTAKVAIVLGRIGSKDQNMALQFPHGGKSLIPARAT